MPIPIFTAQCTGTRLILDDSQRFHEYLRGLSGPVEIIVRRPRRQRSNSQNAYYWGVLVPIMAEYCGYDSEEMHTALRLRFLKVEEADSPIPSVRSTASLDTKEFTEYIENCRRLAAEWSLRIPNPGEAE